MRNPECLDVLSVSVKVASRIFEDLNYCLNPIALYDKPYAPSLPYSLDPRSFPALSRLSMAVGRAKMTQTASMKQLIL